MPTTPRGIWYPDSTATANTWEHWEQQGESVDVAIGAAQVAAVDEAKAYVDDKQGHYAGFASSDFNVTNDAEVPLSMSGVVEQLGGVTWDNGVKKWTVEDAGVYLVNVSVTWASSGSGQRRLRVVRDFGVTTTIATTILTPSASSVTMDLSASVFLGAGATLQPFVRQTSGGTLQVLGGASPRYTHAELTRIG